MRWFEAQTITHARQATKMFLPDSKLSGVIPRVVSRYRIPSDSEGMPQLKLRLGSGRNHHPRRAARAGTPVRSRFCNAQLTREHGRGTPVPPFTSASKQTLPPE